MTKQYIFTVQSLSEPLRLDTYLSSLDLFSSRAQIQTLIKKSQIYVNGEIKKSSRYNSCEQAEKYAYSSDSKRDDRNTC